MNGHGRDFGHEFVSESVSEADSDKDTRFFGTSDSDTDMGSPILQHIKPIMEGIISLS